jgi:hypothetical protein
MSKTIKFVNEEIYSDIEKPNLEDRFLQLFGSWKGVDDQGSPAGLSFVPESNSPFTWSVNKQTRIHTSEAGIGLTVRYQTILEVKDNPAFPVPLDPSSYIEFDKKFSDFSTEFQAPELYIDARNKNTKPATDVVFDYEVENIEYEDLNNTVKEEIGLLNYYEPYQNDSDLKLRALRFLDSAINEYNTSEKKRFEYKNLIVPPENVSTLQTSNLDFLDTTIHQSGDLDPGWWLPHEGNHGLRDALTFSQQLPLVNRISMLISGVAGAQNPPLLLNNVIFFAPWDPADPWPCDLPVPDPDDLAAYDLGTNLLRWHSEYPEYFTELKNCVYSRTLDQSDGTTVNANIKQPIVSYNFEDWLNNYAPSELESLNNTTKILSASPLYSPSVNLAVNNYAIPIQFGTAAQTAASRYIESVGNYANVKKIDDVLTGLPGKQEVLYFKIEKYEGNNTNGSPLQTIFIPNIYPTRDATTKYLDTQVFYNKEYTYKIFYVIAVHGCEYEYKKIEVVSAEGAPTKTYHLTVDSYLSTRVIEFPAFEKTGKILARQPLVPSFELIPIRRRKNRFKLSFKTNYGDGTVVPTSLTQFDERNILQAKVNEYFPIIDGDEMLEYSSISTVANFEIYKSDLQPLDLSTYNEFKENFFAAVPVDVDPNSKLSADSAAAVISLVPDQKYYFTFIARNRLGIASNPTGIFEIQLVDSDGLSYPMIKEVTGDRKKDTRKNSKTLSKVVTIRPEVNHTQVNYTLSDLSPISKKQPIVLGVKDDTLFGSSGVGPDANTGKKFKFRFRSKKTSRMFDVNVTCKISRVATPFDAESPPPSIQSTLDPTSASYAEALVLEHGYSPPKVTIAYEDEEDTEFPVDEEDLLDPWSSAFTQY